MNIEAFLSLFYCFSNECLNVVSKRSVRSSTYTLVTSISIQKIWIGLIIYK